MQALAEAVDAALDADGEKTDTLQEKAGAWASSCRRWKMAWDYSPNIEIALRDYRHH